MLVNGENEESIYNIYTQTIFIPSNYNYTTIKNATVTSPTHSFEHTPIILVLSMYVWVYHY